MTRGWCSALLCAAGVFALAAACSSEDEFTSTPTDAGTDTGSGGTGGSAGSSSDASDSAAGTDGGSDATVEVCSDVDMDGTTDCDGDCDDNDPLNYPGNTEICGDNADNDCDQAPDQVCGGLGTYVSANTGDDANPGTKDQPVKSITKGIANGQSILGNGGLSSIDVFVAEGHYAEKVKLIEKVSVLGGFSCATQPCSWARDPQQYTSVITNVDFEGVLADFTITKATRLDSFTIEGMGGDPSNTAPGSVALMLKGGTPTVVNNTITGGNVTTGVANRNSIGIAVLAPSNDVQGALIDSNTVSGGIGLEISTAILMSDVVGSAGKPYAVITRNTLTSGKGKSSRGVLVWASGTGTIIRDNDITGGEGIDNTWGISIGSIALIEANRVNTGTPPLGGNAASWSGGIESLSSTTVIINNVVFGAEAPQSAGVRLAEVEGKAGTVILNGNYVEAGGAQNPISGTKSAAISLFNPGGVSTAAIIGRIANNILIAGKGSARYGIYEAQNGSSKTVHPESLLNNDIFIANATQADALYAFWTGAAFDAKTTIADVNALAAQLGSVANNISADPLIDATWHLSTGSPCVDTGTSIDAPGQDLDGETRPKGMAFDIGPDEAQ